MGIPGQRLFHGLYAITIICVVFTLYIYVSFESAKSASS